PAARAWSPCSSGRLESTAVCSASIGSALSPEAPKIRSNGGTRRGGRETVAFKGGTDMNILVCMKQILDPEIPARDFRIDSARCEAERGSAALVTNIFCENALETALQFREAHGGKITTITCGSETAEDILRKALALRADEAVLVA